MFVNIYAPIQPCGTLWGNQIHSLIWNSVRQIVINGGLFFLSWVLKPSTLFHSRIGPGSLDWFFRRNYSGKTILLLTPLLTVLDTATDALHLGSLLRHIQNVFKSRSFRTHFFKVCSTVACRTTLSSLLTLKQLCHPGLQL